MSRRPAVCGPPGGPVSYPPCRALRIGLAYDLFGSYPLRPGDPPDAEVEYEPEATVLVLEAALRRLGHEPLRLGNPHAVLRAAGQERLPRLDAVLTIAEGYGPRNREAWVPALCEMAGIPALGSDALTLSTTLDKLWAHRVVAAAGVPVPAHASLASPEAGGGRALAGAVPALRQAALGGNRQGDRAELAGREPRRPRARGRPRRHDLRAAGAGRGVPRGARVHGDAGGPRAARGPCPRSSGRSRSRPASGPTPSSGTRRRRGAGVTSRRARSTRRSRPSWWRSARRAFEALECRDFARADFRLDRGGRPALPRDEPAPDVRARRLLRHHRGDPRATARRSPGGGSRRGAGAARPRPARLTPPVKPLGRMVSHQAGLPSTIRRDLDGRPEHRR